MARYVKCCTKLNLQHITLAKRAWVGMAPESPSPFSILRSADLITLFIARFMTDNRKRAGRKPKADTTVFRCSVNFTATEQATLMSMYDKVQVESMSAFIKMVLFEKPFKVFYMDENTRVFIDKLSSLNSLYRTVGVEAILEFLENVKCPAAKPQGRITFFALFAAGRITSLPPIFPT